MSESQEKGENVSPVDDIGGRPVLRNASPCWAKPRLQHLKNCQQD